MRSTVEVTRLCTTAATIGPLAIRKGSNADHKAHHEAKECYRNANQQCPMGGTEAGADEISEPA